MNCVGKTTGEQLRSPMPSADSSTSRAQVISTMFEAKPLVGEFTARSEPQALMQGEEVVALVFEERYAQLLSQAPQMLELIERVAAGACEFGANGEHDCDCCACAAREFLADLPPAPLLN